MSEIKVDKGVAIPRPRNKYPWENMRVGDSFAIEIKDEAQAAHIRTAAYYRSQVSKEHFVTRVLEERGRTVIRVWRDE